MIFKSTTSDDAIYTCQCDNKNHEIRLWITEDDIAICVRLSPRPLLGRIKAALGYALGGSNEYIETFLAPDDAAHFGRKLVLASNKVRGPVRKQEPSANDLLVG